MPVSPSPPQTLLPLPPLGLLLLTRLLSLLPSFYFIPPSCYLVLFSSARLTLSTSCVSSLCSSSCPLHSLSSVPLLVYCCSSSSFSPSCYASFCLLILSVLSLPVPACPFPPPPPPLLAFLPFVLRLLLPSFFFIVNLLFLPITSSLSLPFHPWRLLLFAITLSFSSSTSFG